MGLSFIICPDHANPICAGVMPSCGLFHCIAHNVFTHPISEHSISISFHSPAITSHSHHHTFSCIFSSLLPLSTICVLQAVAYNWVYQQCKVHVFECGARGCHCKSRLICQFLDKGNAKSTSNLHWHAKSIGVKRLWLQLTTLGMSKLPKTFWQVQEVWTCQSQHCFNMQPRGVSLTVTINTPKLKHSKCCFDRCKFKCLNYKLSVPSLYIGLQRVSSQFKL